MTEAQPKIRWFALPSTPLEAIECEDQDHCTAVIRMHDEGTCIGLGAYKDEGEWILVECTERLGRRWQTEKMAVQMPHHLTIRLERLEETEDA